MGKTKTKSRSGSLKDVLHGTSATVKSSGRSKLQSKSTEDLLTEAAALLEQSQPELALPLADEALRRLEAERQHYADTESLLRRAAEGKHTYPEALTVTAQAHLSMGNVDKARGLYERAVVVDPDGALISAEPWLELAQICEEGGRKSIEYFEKASEVLRNEVEVLEEETEGTQGQEKLQVLQVIEEKRARLAEALCAMAEVFMTDLSWEVDAESRCESFVTEAVAICPERLSAGTLQTFASVRISQQRIDEARQALARSMTLWKDISDEVQDPAKPDFATRVSLVRLLMEVQAELEAMFVVEGLVKEDDQSVESLYLGGWCQMLLGQKDGISKDEEQKYAEQARIWLGNCLKLYDRVEYEDDRLREHALELIGVLNKALGITDGDDEWEDEDDEEEDEADDGDDDNLELGDMGDENHHDGDVEMT